MPSVNRAVRQMQPPLSTLIAGLCLAAFVLSVSVSRIVFERLPHLEDEFAYLYQASIFAGGQLSVTAPQPTQAYWQPFVVDYNGQRFSKYPPGWSLLLAPGVLTGAPWMVNALLSALNVALTFRLGADVFSKQAGLFAALLVTFSPMAILLNATLMSHTAALCATNVFMIAYLRLWRSARPDVRWALAAGSALGMLAALRPFSAGAMALPFLLDALFRWRKRHARWALAGLGTAALTIGLLVPSYNRLTTGDFRTNPYLLVWSYDRIGFGEGIGRSGEHTLAKGIRQTGYDLSLAAADLYGWQWGTFDDTLRQHALGGAGKWERIGLSWVLLPFGIGLGVLHRYQRRASLLLTTVALMLIVAHTAYWVGAQRYSTRYYYEALTAVSVLSALPLAWLARRWRTATGVALGVVLLYAGMAYTAPRIGLLQGFNGVTQAQIDAINAQRQTNAPVLVIITPRGDVPLSWRAHGALLAVTSPYLDGDLVLARDDAAQSRRSRILAAFPDREVIDLWGVGSTWGFAHAEPTPSAATESSAAGT